MNLLQCTVLMSIVTFSGLATVQAKDVTVLPTIQVMAESEMREEVVGPAPFQEDEKVQQALQHYLYKVHNDMQNTGVSEITATVDYQPKMAEPDLSQLSPVLQQYILAVAAGFQSSDPTNGLFKILEPLNINRNNVNDFRNGTIKVNVDDILKLQQQIRDGLNPPQNPLFPR